MGRRVAKEIEKVEMIDLKVFEKNGEKGQGMNYG